MGPRKASEIFLNRHPEAVAFEVILYGSLAATGKGHLTDVAILDTLQPPGRDCVETVGISVVSPERHDFSLEK